MSSQGVSTKVAGQQGTSLRAQTVMQNDGDPANIWHFIEVVFNGLILTEAGSLYGNPEELEEDRRLDHDTHVESNQISIFTDDPYKSQDLQIGYADGLHDLEEEDRHSICNHFEEYWDLQLKSVGQKLVFFPGSEREVYWSLKQAVCIYLYLILNEPQGVIQEIAYDPELNRGQMKITFQDDSAQTISTKILSRLKSGSPFIMTVTKDSADEKSTPGVNKLNTTFNVNFRVAFPFPLIEYLQNMIPLNIFLIRRDYSRLVVAVLRHVAHEFREKIENSCYFIEVQTAFGCYQINVNSPQFQHDLFLKRLEDFGIKADKVYTGIKLPGISCSENSIFVRFQMANPIALITQLAKGKPLIRRAREGSSWELIASSVQRLLTEAADQVIRYDLHLRLANYEQGGLAILAMLDGVQNLQNLRAQVRLLSASLQASPKDAKAVAGGTGSSATAQTPFWSPAMGQSGGAPKPEAKDDKQQLEIKSKLHDLFVYVCKTISQEYDYAFEITMSNLDSPISVKLINDNIPSYHPADRRSPSRFYSGITKTDGFFRVMEFSAFNPSRSKKIAAFSLTINNLYDFIDKARNHYRLRDQNHPFLAYIMGVEEAVKRPTAKKGPFQKHSAKINLIEEAQSKYILEVESAEGEKEALILKNPEQINKIADYCRELRINPSNKEQLSGLIAYLQELGSTGTRMGKILKDDMEGVSRPDAQVISGSQQCAP